MGHPAHNAAPPHMSPTAKSSAFSLVEVVVAIGILAFSLASLFALLSLSIRQSLDNALSQLAAEALALAESAIRAQSAADATRSHTFSSSYFPLSMPHRSWHPDSPAVEGTLLLGAGAEILPDQTIPPENARLKLRYLISPLSQDPPAVQVLLQVAWPPQAYWDDGWRGAAGSRELSLIATP